MKFLVLGGGVQGMAAAYDLLRDPAVERVCIADLDAEAVHNRLNPHLGDQLGPHRSDRLTLRRLDATKPAEVTAAMDGVSGVLCALPYHLNPAVTRLAVATGVHFTDLGGNTALVERQRELDQDAIAQGISVVPDTGLAPGMVNIFAQAGIDALDETDAVRLWVGGLPQNPRPPLNYQVVYSLEGMLDYYVTPAAVLRDGRVVEVKALSGLETLDFPSPVGRLEAFFTGGGSSGMPARYEGQVGVLEYKTLRYPGHARIMRAIRDLGLLDNDEILHDGCRIRPRQFFIQQATPSLTRSGGDLVVLRVDATGRRDGVPTRVRFELLELQDPVTGITAMARTTGFSLAITALMQARRELPPGVRTPDQVIPPRPFIRALAERGIHVTCTQVPI